MEHRPKRAAAVAAEELYREELRNGNKEEEDDEDDEEYIVEEDPSFDPQNDADQDFHQPDHSFFSQGVWKKANELFSQLEPTVSPRAVEILQTLKREAAQELPLNPLTKRHRSTLYYDPLLEHSLSSSPSMPEHHELALDIARNVLLAASQSRVNEQVKFAGEMVTVVNTTTTTNAALNSTKSKSTLEEMLEGLTKKRVVSTVEKSSYDWNAYKEANSLQVELEHAGKDGFVEKQAFLHRVDYRQFEHERDQRERDFAQRSMTTQ